MPKPDCSELALNAAKEFVRYIEDFRSMGTGDMKRKHPDYDFNGDFGGYDNIVVRAKKLASDIDGFDGRLGHRREAA